jgi:microcystin-dependent protein
MSDPYYAEIRIFAGNFAPTGWALCDGQIMPIAQNTALFSLLGTNYGGNGTTTFGLPNLQGSAPIGAGQGPGLSSYVPGETLGEQYVTLLSSEMPVHTHAALVQSDTTKPSAVPTNNTWGPGGGRGRPSFYAAPPANAQMAPLALSVAGGSQPHNNMPPYLGLTFIIAVSGIYPPR